VAEIRTLDRRQFTLATALAALSGVVITISSACGSSSSSSPTGSTGGNSDKVGVISSNHGHSAVITGAQLTAGGALELNIQGAASHPHTVTLSAAEIGQIAANQQVAKQSSTNNSHSHTVTFN
jgi:hypothetical protein